MRLLITAPLQVATGNESSAKRLKKYFEEVNIKCWLKDCNEFDSSIVFNRYVTQNDITAVLAVHAYRGGRLLKDCSVPYGLVLGGTDVNELYKDDDKLVVMTLAVTNARFIIGFSKPMYQQAVWLWPDIACKLWVQPQGVITTPSASFNFKYHVHEHCDVSYDSHIFLLVAGIRPVKDPLYIVQAFSEWYLKDSNIHLVIVGPEIDKELTKTVKGTVAKLAGVSILPVLSLFDMHAAIRDSFALVNSSLSEGMSAAILE
ncbi:glycosyltransferase 1 domain-containing protein 1-like, partial [Saccoglossus kowalevskii]|uniref:Glycosyltransferase 1 domain-containing protein 1-like n=1 Tax=Saccoglossus kowalevskii TaxID=10224 RepID=A0ABM0M0H2_SACKO